VIVPEDIELAFQKIEESKINHNVYEVDYRIARANDGEIGSNLLVTITMYWYSTYHVVQNKEDRRRIISSKIN
jgi:hypothetical protein